MVTASRLRYSTVFLTPSSRMFEQKLKTRYAKTVSFHIFCNSSFIIIPQFDIMRSCTVFSVLEIVYEGVSKCSRTEPVTKYTLTTSNTKGYGGKTY
jgi:hypothetical protein